MPDISVSPPRWSGSAADTTTDVSSMAADSRTTEDEEETQSLSASITDYPTYWCRRYHKFRQNSYHYPNDEDECERLDLQHSLIKDLHADKLFFAPVKDAKKILDIGTGTGIWAIQVADLDHFPDAQIIGTDLSPIQPDEVPANVSFEIQDCTDANWNRPLGSIDFIHTRLMLGALERFDQLIRNARRYLTPGTGWLECHELDPTIYSDDNTIPAKWPLKDWQEQFIRVAAMADPPKPLDFAQNIRGWMEQEGFVDVHEHINRMPIGSWPKAAPLKRIGKYWRENISTGLGAFSYKLFGSEGLRWSQEEVEVFLAQVRNSMADRHVHSYQKLHVVYGRRPTAQEEVTLRAERQRSSRGVIAS